MYYVSKILSVVLHPIFMPVFALYLVFNTDSVLNYNTLPQLKTLLYIMSTVLLIILPLISTFILWRGKFISSIEAPLREERFYLYFNTLIYYGMTYFILSRKMPGIDDIVLSMMLGATIAIAVSFLFNFFTKISTHMVGISGVAGAYLAAADKLWLADYSVFYILCVLMGIVGFARLSLLAHKEKEIYLGLFVGFCCEYFVVKYNLLL